ncbi:MULTISPECIES: hypothetical protein [unclassified Streptomyces]|uniref:hypothetical protein n=1 Tax=unclassified Streptomyces TaxID=2593676 RepID=UPI002E2933DC|nr:hypothetical protein [Streptomyces sp. NBC_00273]
MTWRLAGANDHAFGAQLASGVTCTRRLRGPRQPRRGRCAGAGRPRGRPAVTTATTTGPNTFHTSSTFTAGMVVARR